MASDLQDPPELISEFIREWQRGTPICIAIKISSDENPILYRLRRLYYRMLAEVQFHQPVRQRGLTKNNVLTLYDIGMLGVINYSKLPLRLAAFTGFIIASFSFLAGFIYLIYKLMYWDNFVVGSAPVAIGMFFLGAVQLLFLGLIGEYLGAIFTQVKDRPLVIEAERINFQKPSHLHISTTKEHQRESSI